KIKPQVVQLQGLVPTLAEHNPIKHKHTSEQCTHQRQPRKELTRAGSRRNAPICHAAHGNLKTQQEPEGPDTKRQKECRWVAKYKPEGKAKNSRNRGRDKEVTVPALSRYNDDSVALCLVRDVSVWLNSHRCFQCKSGRTTKLTCRR